MKIYSYFLLIICLLFISDNYVFTQNISGKDKIERPKISFTFDDGSTDDFPGYKLEVWNEMLLSTLKKYNIKAVLFVKGSGLNSEKGKSILKSWDDAGHKIANHTFSHFYFPSAKISLKQFELDFLKNDSIIRNYKNFYPYFRFPYLKEGNTEEKINGFRSFLNEKGYKNGHVTIDASDWYISDRLVKRLTENPGAGITEFQKYYIAHLFGRAIYYDSIATALTGRKITHTILLHHNLAAALFLDELINHFKSSGWEIMNADEAYKDEIFKITPSNIPAGESLIWALAKQSGKFENILRYPAEDGEYEKPNMDKLGL